jgi:tetratricopeptide (TPR) repeat protein
VADSAVALLQRFVAALNRRSRGDANEAGLALLAMEAPLRDKWRLVAKVLQTNGELGAANEAMALLVAQVGGAPSQFEQAALAAQSGRLEQARQIVQGLPSNVPTPAANAYFLGTMALNVGEIDEAEGHFLRALDSDPRLGQAMLALASCRTRPADDPVGEQILGSAEVMRNAPPLERAQYHYAAGRIRLDRREADGAFADFRAGGALAAGERPYNAAADAAYAVQSREGFDAALIERIGGAVSVDTSDAIFVTGLPRSGTTLVEQILASHSAVAGGEELGRMAVVARDLPEASASGLEAWLGNGGSADALARLYLHLCRERFPARGRFVDKGLNNARYMGLIAALLPRAPIVWLRRDPLDCAWSAFRTYFVQGLEWSWKLEDIAAHFRLEDELFSFWRQVLPDRILVVDYARLVCEPKEQIERIVAHCGLAPEPQVFEPHKTARVVATASATQVREPINRKGLGSSESYRQHLRPFSEAYASA